MNSRTVSIVLNDGCLNTPRLATNTAGLPAWSWDSDGFGAVPANSDPLASGTTTTINLRFPAQYYDLETGLHYNWNRYYDPRTGRYITSDPIGLAGGANTYRYVDANPTRWVDLEGLDFLGKDIALDYIQRYGSSGAWQRIRHDRDSTKPVVLGTHSEALRNAEHYLYVYQQVSDESYNWGKMIILTVGYNAWKFWANVGEYYGLFASPYTYTINTIDELKSGLEGANDALYGLPSTEGPQNCAIR